MSKSKFSTNCGEPKKCQLWEIPRKKTRRNCGTFVKKCEEIDNKLT